ncbi:MAG: Crp/Fnr family transcriptional regulator [Alphaproteobacteria bacterium]|nr:Crp/Fnr family transcriptional regulator [Alphaproteobacteria bacterium]MBV9372035.1 Crp/Fnr family transcriptional regulator [Alphaproteobacteria bacterium]MBV9902655.1 Crp/Fnr family transcriptional regulator [Alphaproteobacteria bacterium]
MRGLRGRGILRPLDGGSGRIQSERCDLEAVGAALACPEATAAQILGQGRIRHYAPHVHIVRRGDRAATAYLVVIGRAQALLYGFDGQLILLHEFGPGDLFGALGGLGGVEEEADIVAAEAVRAFLLEAGVLVALAERHGAIGLALSRVLLKRLRATSVRMYERTALSAPGRVCAELARLARAGRGTIRPAPIVAELALRAGTTRETASRTVNGLERRGIIRRDADALTVVAPGRLEGEIL